MFVYEVHSFEKLSALHVIVLTQKLGALTPTFVTSVDLQCRFGQMSSQLRLSLVSKALSHPWDYHILTVLSVVRNASTVYQQTSEGSKLLCSMPQ